MCSHLGISCEIRRPHLISGPSSPHCVDSAVLSQPPFVHGFPSLIDARERVRPGEIVFLFLIVRVFSSTLLPGFIGPKSSVLPVNLPPSVPSRFGVSSSSRFAVVAGNPRRQDRRASLGKTHHLPISRPASCQVSAPDIRPCLVTSARPPPQHHLAGSLFATYMGSASCFLQTSHFGRCPCRVGVVLPSGNGGPSCSRLSSGTAACAACQAHMKNPAAS
jgi:hypothetical protein